MSSGELRGSVHAALACVDCHRDIASVPHPGELPAVDCAYCHEPPRERGIGRDESVEANVSRHRQGGERGTTAAIKCTDCHGGHGTLPVTDVSAADAVHMVDRCASCHVEAAAEYSQSTHGSALLKGAVDAPTCMACHPEHLHRYAHERAGVLETGIVATCASCHEDAGMQEKFSLPKGRLASYLGSYHGVARQFGDMRTANCVSCHGHHSILPSTDPASSTHPRNLARTCGECHPGVNENVAKGRVHVLATPESRSLVYHVNFAFRFFTTVIIGGLLGHIGLDLFGRWRGRTGD